MVEINVPLMIGTRLFVSCHCTHLDCWLKAQTYCVTLCDFPNPIYDNNKKIKHVSVFFYTNAKNHDINTNNSAVAVCHTISMASAFEYFQKHVGEFYRLLLPK